MSSPVVDPKRRALGRGLDALLPAAREQPPGYGDKSVFSCALERLTPQKGQPRQYFAKDKIDDKKTSDDKRDELRRRIRRLEDERSRRDDDRDRLLERAARHGYIN